MTAVTEQIVAFFDLAFTGGFFTLDDDTRGELDNSTYLLAGEIATDITSSAWSASSDRGRSFELDEIQAGRMDVEIRNYDAQFFPNVYNVTVDTVLLTDDDDELLTDSDDELLMEGGAFGADDDNIKPGTRIQWIAEGVTIFDGAAEDWRFGYDAETGHVDCAVSVEDALASLARRFFLEWTTTDAQLPGARIAAVLNRSEVDFGVNRDIDTGVSTLQDDLVTWGSNVLNYLQLVAKSDLGRLFASRNNVLTFRDRHSLNTSGVAVAFSDTGAAGTIPFRHIDLDVSSALLYTDVSVDREGGTQQTATDSDAREEYGTRKLVIPGLLVNSDSQCLDIANFLLGIYKVHQLRVNSLTCRLDGLDVEDRVTVLALEIGDVVSVTWTPTGASSAMERNCVVEGVGHSASHDGPHDVFLRLSLVQEQTPFILDDDVLGELDAGVLSF